MPSAVMNEDRAARVEEPPIDFAALYRRHYHEVVRWARALGGPGTDVEDLAQDVFVVAHRQLARFDGVSATGWLYEIARRTVSDRRRSAWFRRIFSRPRNVVLEDVLDTAADPLQRLVRKEAQRAFYELARAVHPTRRDTFLLFEVGGLSGDEIATLEGVPTATVWTRLHLARKEFMTAVARSREDA